MSFYVTLPSNSSSKYFKDNTLTHYTTKLFNPIVLEGSYEVALTEIMYPMSWISNQDATFYFGVHEAADKKHELQIDMNTKKYGTLDECINDLNYVIKMFKVNLRSKQLELNQTPKEKKDAILANDKQRKYVAFNGIANRLQFYIESNEYVTFDEKSQQLFGMEHSHYDGINAQSMRPIQNFINNNSSLYVYTDIVNFQYVGDAFAPIIRVVHVPRVKFGENVHIIYDTPHYVPVTRSMFETIEIDIRTDTGEPILFSFGKVILKLHFRPRRFF